MEDTKNKLNKLYRIFEKGNFETFVKTCLIANVSNIDIKKMLYNQKELNTSLSWQDFKSKYSPINYTTFYTNYIDSKQKKFVEDLSQYFIDNDLPKFKWIYFKNSYFTIHFKRYSYKFHIDESEPIAFLSPDYAIDLNLNFDNRNDIMLSGEYPQVMKDICTLLHNDVILNIMGFCISHKQFTQAYKFRGLSLIINAYKNTPTMFINYVNSFKKRYKDGKFQNNYKILHNQEVEILNIIGDKSECIYWKAGEKIKHFKSRSLHLLLGGERI